MSSMEADGNTVDGVSGSNGSGRVYGRMTIPAHSKVAASPGDRGCLVVRSDGGDAVMVVEAYAIPRSAHPWKELLASLGRKDEGLIMVGDVMVVGEDDGRVLARAYISGDEDGRGRMLSVFRSMRFLRGDEPMPPMTVLSAAEDDVVRI